jgi:hypothetical protein
MTNPPSQASRYRPAKRTGAAVAAAGILAAVLAPALSTAPAHAVEPTGEACSSYGAAAAGDVLTLRLLDVRPLGIQVPPIFDLKFATTRAGLTASTGRTAAQSKYIQGTWLGLAPPVGTLETAAHQLAPPAPQRPTIVNTGRLDLGVARAGTGDLTAKATYRDTSRCDPTSGAGAEAAAAVADTAVLPGTRPLLHAPNSLSTTARAGFVRHQGRAGVEAATSAGLANLALLETLRVRVVSQPKLRAVAAGSAARSTVEYTAPVLSVGRPDGPILELDQPTKTIDFAVPAAGASPLAGLPVLPGNPLPELLGALPGVSHLLPSLGGLLSGGSGADAGSGAGAAATAESVVSTSAGSPGAPAVPGLAALSGVPAVGGLLGGAGPLAAPVGQTSVVLRLTSGELSKEITDAGVHAKAITLRVKLLVVRGEAVTTVLDLCVGVLEVAATAAASTRGEGGGYGGEEPSETESPSAPASPSAGGGSGSGSGGENPGSGTGQGSNLPVTGVALSVILGSGFALLATGRLLMVLARRRRLTG